MSDKNIYNCDSISFLKKINDLSVDVNYSDPPYALGSEVIIRPDGKVDYAKATDFMGKWKMPNGDYWNEWFNESYRVLKHGGYCIMFGMDRQLLMFKYYALLNGFIEKQSMYWYFMCLSDDSEILTRDGWRNINNIKDEDNICEFNMDTRCIEYNKCIKIYKYKYSDNLIRIKNEYTDQLVTPNHKCIVLQNGDIKLKNALDIVGGSVQILTIDEDCVNVLIYKTKYQKISNKIRKIFNKKENNNLNINYRISNVVPYTERFKGYVWCVETVNGAFIARRNGKVFITGNSNFPKSTDLSKNIDNNAGVTRTIIGKNPNGGGENKGHSLTHGMKAHPFLTKPETELAHKYDGYKYSVSPLKQTNETVLIFQKPYKTGSCLKDTLEYENGDNTCLCGAVNIEGNRCGEGCVKYGCGELGKTTYNKMERIKDVYIYRDGRYPAQTIVDDETSKILDNQGKKEKKIKDNKQCKITWSLDIEMNNDKKEEDLKQPLNCSDILFKANFEKNEHDIYIYMPKVSKTERQEGCDKSKEEYDVDEKIENNHPTLKPIKLNENILKLFKTPNEQYIIYPFSGSGSEIIGGVKAGFSKWDGCEINKEYCIVSKNRIKHWTDIDITIKE